MNQIRSFNAECDMVRKFMEVHGGSKTTTWQMLKEWQPPQDDDIPNIEKFTINDWEYFILEEDHETQFNVFREVGLTRILDYPQTRIKDIGVEDTDRFVAVIAPVVAMSEIKPHWSSVSYECVECAYTVQASQMPGNKAPLKCPDCANRIRTKFNPNNTKTGNVQGIQLSEDGQLITGLWTGRKQDMWKVKEGQKVYAFGIVRFEIYQNRQANRADVRKYIDLLHVESILKNQISLTAEDIWKFEKAAEDPEALYELIVNSYAPHIHGNRNLKEVCIFAIASQGFKRPINALLGGPPGTGKSQLLEYSADISPEGVFQTIENASAAGLTASANTDKAAGIQYNRKGLFVIFKVVCLTELQAIPKDMKSQLNDAMERKKVAISKNVGYEEFDAACVCIFDTNNFEATWDYNNSLAYNMQYMIPNLSTFLSRIDLIAIVERYLAEQDHDDIAHVNFHGRRTSDEPVEMHLEDWETEDHEQRWGFNTLRKFFHYVTHLREPPIDENLEQYYVDSYMEIRKHDYDRLIDGRYHSSVLRLARCRARMLLKQKGVHRDLEHAMELVNRSKNIQVAVNLIDPDNAEKDPNPVAGVQPRPVIKSFFNEEEEFLNCINEVLAATGKGYFTLEELQDYIVNKKRVPNWTEVKVRNMVKKWTWDTQQLDEDGPAGCNQFKLRRRADEQRRL